MIFHVMTLFPELIEACAGSSILGRAKEKALVEVRPVNIRDYSKDKHKHVDDYPYGGGAGMLMKPEPVYDCYRAITAGMEKKPRVLYMTPQGKRFDQEDAKKFAKEDELIFLCGHYEGIDERVLQLIVTDEVSVGDFVVTGGELPAMLMIDAISRMIPGVLSENSAEDESFYASLLEYPQYTRPEEFLGLRVPEVLLSGHHKNVETWRRQESLRRTLERRPELLQKADLQKEDRKFLKKLEAELQQERLLQTEKGNS